MKKKIEAEKWPLFVIIIVISPYEKQRERRSQNDNN